MADISQINFPNDANNPYDVADTTARSGLADKMDKVNPTGSGSFSLNRKADTTIGTNSFAEGYNTTASGQYSHAEGANTRASGQSAHAEGVNSVASGTYCPHAEGYQTTASGSYSHAEGINTTARGNHSHSEGEHTTASGICSHAENGYTTASAHYAHAEGYYTTAKCRSQHVFGEYNVLDDSTSPVHVKGNYVEIVGNGTADDSRSNARTLDWSGNEVLSGTIEATGFGTTLDKEVDRGGVQLTQAQYDALVNAGTVDANTTYFITDANNTTASYAAGVTYDNTDSGLTATNVQDAIDEVADDISTVTGTITLETGFTARGTPIVEKRNGMVFLQFNINGTNTFNTRTTLGNISAGFRPYRTCAFTVCASKKINSFANITTTMLITLSGDIIVGDLVLPAGSDIKEVNACVTYVARN